MNPGIYDNLSNKEYHSSKGISKTGLDLIHKSPDEYNYFKTHAREIPPTLQKIFDLGSFTHSLILEPEKTASEFVKGIKVDKRTKAGKLEWAEFVESSDGMIVIDPKDYELATLMSKSVQSHEIAKEMLKNGKAETSIFAEEYGTLLKIRPDWITGNTIVDVKTVSSLAEFEKSILNHRYYVQAYFYRKVARLAGLDIKEFKFLAVSKSLPIQTAIYTLSADYLRTGRIECEKDLSTYRTCLDFNHFGYVGDTDEIIVNKPAWIK